MPSLDATIDTACQHGTIPGAAAAATNRDGIGRLSRVSQTLTRSRVIHILQGMGQGICQKWRRQACHPRLGLHHSLDDQAHDLHLSHAMR